MNGVSVTLSRCWIALASDLSSSIQIDADSIDEAPTMTGQVRTYAGGRQRSIVRAGIANQVTLKATLVDPATLSTLTSWLGQTMLLRTPFGDRWWVTLFAAPRAATPGSFLKETSSMSIQGLPFQVVSFDESV